MHVIPRTKNRAPLLDDSVRTALDGYLATAARQVGRECFSVRGVADRVYLAFRVCVMTVKPQIPRLRSG